LLQAAENGFAPAQYNVGCYWRDKADPNHHEAYSWFKKAAEQNYGPAQFNLGILCGNAGNYAAAYVWLYLAEHNRVDKAKEYREKVASSLSQEDLNAARLSVSAWMAGFRRKSDRTHVESE
jgi:TPR repeat protein